MVHVTSLYKEITNGKYTTEFELEIDGFKYYKDSVISLNINRKLFANGAPSVGGFTSGEIDIVMLKPSEQWSRMAEIKVRHRVTNGRKTSEFVPDGTFYIDTRKPNMLDHTMTVHGYDSALKAEQLYIQNGSKSGWPKSDIAVYDEICKRLDVSADPDTRSSLKGYSVSCPGIDDGALTMREVAKYVAAAECGNFYITADNKLRLVRLNSLPESIGYIIKENGSKILVGGKRIRVS